MPLLDVSDILDDPDFADAITVARVIETVNNNGRSEVTTATFETSGVVTADKGDVLQRTPDGQRVTGSILVHTAFEMKAGDIVTWNERQYTAANPNDYSHFGAGFVSVVCDLKPLE